MQQPQNSYQNAPSNEGDFPPVGGNEQPAKRDKKGFQNTLFPSDCLTSCSGFINEVKSRSKDGNTLYFARLGLIMGSKKNDNDEYVGNIVNADLLVGSTLQKWAEACSKNPEGLNGIRMRFEIRNLVFEPGIYNDKPVLDSRGILETVKFGHID